MQQDSRYRSAGAMLAALFIVAGCGGSSSTPEAEQASQDLATETGSASTALPVLEALWVLDGFAEPESSVLSADGTFYYVSNVDGGPGAMGGAGFISRISTDGSMLERDWATGLNAPKGMALTPDGLFVADNTALVHIDTATGAIIERIDMPGNGLNDVAASETMGILVTNAAGREIYQYNNEMVSLFVEDERLKGLNGVLIHDGMVLTVTMPGGELIAIDPETKALTPLASRMQNADMVVPLDEIEGLAGGYIVSSWPGVLWHVSPEGETRMLQDTRSVPIMMNDIALYGDVLIAPNMNPGTVTAYRVTAPR